MNIKIIVAVSNNNCIGKDNELVLTHKDDFKHFKKLTKGGNVIMGRKTWDSLPKKPLENRGNFYVTKNKKDSVYSTVLMDSTSSIFNPFIINTGYSLKNVLNYFYQKEYDKTLWVIGGGTLYKEFLDLGLVNEIYITRWSQDKDGDTFFPELNTEEWTCKYIMPHESGLFKFETWLKKPLG